MELESSYQLLGVMRDDGIRTYRAVDNASGQELQVHLFTKPDSDSDRALFKAIRALPVSKRRELLEIGMEGDLPYIVTEKLPDNSTAREWLTKFAGIPAKPVDSVFLAGTWKTGTPIPEELRRASHAAAPPSPAIIKPAELSPDYTRVMRIPKVERAAPAEVVAPKPKPEPAPVLPVEPPPVVPAAPAPDEFSRLFGSAPPPPPVVSAPVIPQPVPPLPVEAVAPKPELVPPVQAPVEQPDEFSRLFGSAPASPPVASAPVISEPPPPPVEAVVPKPEPVSSPVHPPAEEPDEFSRLFVNAPAAPPVAAAPQAKEPGEFTRMFLAAEPPESSPGPGPSASGDEPGEFTRMFLAGKAPSPPQPQPVNTVQPPRAPLQSEAPPQQAALLYQAVEPPAPPPALQANTPPAVQPPPVQPSPDGPTRLFQAVTPSSPPPSEPPPPVQPVKEPGEFTRMFPPVEPSGSPLPPGTASQSPAPPAKAGPSEFTRFFQSPMYPSQPGKQRMPSSTSTPGPQQVSRPSAQPSEFTQMFGNPNQPPSAPPPASGSGGSATGLFSLGKSSAPRPQPPPNGGVSGPGEFTRMMSASAAPTLGQPPAAGKAPQQPAKVPANSNVLLYVAGGAVLVAIILIIVFFFLRH
jgi:hypothetical protein